MTIPTQNHLEICPKVCAIHERLAAVHTVRYEVGKHKNVFWVDEPFRLSNQNLLF